MTMKKILPTLVLFFAVWMLDAQTALQEIPANCIVYVTGQTSAVMKDPVNGRMLCMFLTKKKLSPADLCGDFSGGVTPDGSAKIVAIMKKPKADQVVQTIFKEKTRKKISVSPDKRKITFVSAAPRNDSSGKEDRRKEFLQTIADAKLKNPVFVLAFLGTDVPEGMEDNLIWHGLQRYADKALFSIEELPGNQFRCMARIICPSAEDAEKCRAKINDALAIIAETEQSTEFTKRVNTVVSGHVLTAEVKIYSMEILACGFRVKLLLNRFGGAGE